MKKVLILLLFSLFIAVVSQATPYLCGETGYIYSNQSFCNGNCNNPCSALTVNNTGSTGSCDASKYKGFVYDPNSQYTYAITTNTGFWTDFDKNSLAIIPNFNVNSVLTSIVKYYNTAAWIGCYDPNMSTSYNTVDTGRFVWTNNSPITYSNWHSGEPNNALLTQDVGVVPTLGEHWCEMSSDGTWNDLGYHYNQPSSQNYAPYLPALVQWYGKLDCVNGNLNSDENSNQTQAENDIISQYCNGVSPCYMCADESKCTPQTECPSGYSYNSANDDCEADATCPAGGSLDANNTNCTASPSYTCPDGYTYNSSNNDCEASAPNPTCKQGGAYNSESGQCVLSAHKGCPAYYSYNSANDDCEADPAIICTAGGIAHYINNQYICRLNPTYICPDSGYTMTNGKCTAHADIACPDGGTYSAGQCSATPVNGSCPSGYTLHGGLCTAPVTSITCPAGGAYNSSYNDCEENKTPVCPTSDGYTYNSESKYCEGSPAAYNCHTGGSYDASIRKCSANIIYTCPDGYTLNQRQCVSSPDYICINGGSYNGSYCKSNVKSVSCPSGYTLNNNKCLSQPACPTDDYTSVTDGKCITPLLPCSANNDNLQVCQKGDDNSSYLCPLNKLKCTATYGNPQCPNGSTLNTTTDKCEAKPDISCPSGYTYIPDIYMCGKIPSCPSGGVLNPNTDKCEIVVTSSMCPNGYSFNSKYNACVKTPVCQNGGTYDPNADRCELPVDYTCPSDYTYNSSLNICQKPPVCSKGTYNTITNRCEKKANATCPSGYTYNSSIGKCVISPTCYGDGTLNTTTDKCETAYGHQCPSGYTYNSNKNICQEPPICSQGTYNKTTNRCEKQADTNCPSGYSYNSTVKKCIASPVCGYGGHLNSSRDKCEISYSPTCPSGYIYNGSDKKCESNPRCPNGSRYSNTYNVCLEKANATCPSGYTYNSSADKCEASPQCPSGTSYNSSLNKCVGSASGGNTVYGSCSKHQSCSTKGCYVTIFGYCNPEQPGCHGPMPNSNTPQCPNNKAPSGGSESGFTSCNFGEGSGCFTYVFYNYHVCSSAYYTCSLNGKKYSSYNTCHNYCKYTKPYRCNSGGTLSGSHCYYSAYCSYSGSLNTSTDKCELSATHHCPSGFSYDSAIHYCKKNPTCSNSGTLNVNIDKCQLPIYPACPNGYTYNSSYNICQENPSCNSGGSYNAGLNECEINNTWSCPSGTTLSGSVCYSNAVCPVGGLNTATDKCETAYTPTCESNYTYNSSLSICQASPICPSGNSYNSSLNKCVQNNTWSCPAGMNLSGSTCYLDAICDSGKLNTTRDKCEASSQPNCFTNGYSYNSSLKKCVSSPVCNYGFYDTSIKLCRLSAANVCPDEYTYNSSTDKCLLPPQCPSGSLYSTTVNQCTTDAEYSCLKGTVYNKTDHLCEINPSCGTGTYDPTENKCFEGENTCPYGSSHKCVSMNGTKYCSNESCEPVGNVDTDNSTNKDKPTDGKVTSSGCQGNIYIFNGNTEKCRPPGIETGFSNCCKKKKDWLGLGRCKASEQKLAKMRAAGECHYVGSYCAVKFLHICVQKKKSYCCFHGILARIVQEQGRKQSLPQSGWGSPKSPECEGFKPDQFQALDWSKIDLSEYYSYIKEQFIPNATEKAQKSINNAVNKLKNEYQQ